MDEVEVDFGMIRHILRMADGIDSESGEQSPLETDTNINQLSVLLQAFAKFVVRNEKRADLWKQFGVQDSALHIRSKAARIALVLEGALDIEPEDVMDDAIDIINYAVFFIRNVREA